MPQGTTIDAATMIECLKSTSKRFISLKTDKLFLKKAHLRIDHARSYSQPLYLAGLSHTQRNLSCSPGTLLSRFKPRFMFRTIKQDLRNDDRPENVKTAM